MLSLCPGAFLGFLVLCCGCLVIWFSLMLPLLTGAVVFMGAQKVVLFFVRLTTKFLARFLARCLRTSTSLVLGSLIHSGWNRSALNRSALNRLVVIS